MPPTIVILVMGLVLLLGRSLLARRLLVTLLDHLLLVILLGQSMLALLRGSSAQA